ncbi:MAG: hypothetical protein LBH00_11345, partial [Planctomycetaceae bacterium]|nr:hypothetical protein [Planctomycetaceae bacterium]
MSLLADGLTFTSFQDGEWFGISETNRQQSNQYSDILGISTIDPKYSGTRWFNNSARQEFLEIRPGETPPYTRRLSYPGSISGDLDTAIINHRITLSPPASGFGVENLAALTINSSGSLTVKTSSLSVNSTLTNKGTLNLGTADHSDPISVSAGNVTNSGTINVYNSARITGSNPLVNTSTGQINLFAAGLGMDVTNAGTISLWNGSTIDSGRTITVKEGGKFTVQGTDNVINAALNVEASKLIITGTSPLKSFVTLNADISGNGANNFVFRNVTVNLQKDYYGTTGSYTVGSSSGWGVGSVLAGAGKGGMDFIIDATYGLNPGVASPDTLPNTFTGQNFLFNNGSVLYIEIGSTNYDKLVASGNVNFAGKTTIVLLNYGNHSSSVAANNIVSTSSGNGVIQIGSATLSTSSVPIVDNKAVISDTSGNNKLTIVSATSGGADVVKINRVTTASDSLSVNIDGVETNAAISSKGWANFSTLLGNVAPDSDLNAAIQNYTVSTGGEFWNENDIRNAVMQLDPVMVSVGYQQSFGFVQKVTAAGRNRMFNRMNQ